MKTPLKIYSVCGIACLMCIGISSGAIYADDQNLQEVAEDINKQLSEIKIQTKEIKKNTPEIQKQIQEIKKQAPEIEKQTKEIKKNTPEIQKQVKEIKKQTPELKEQLKIIKEQTPKIQKNIIEIKKQAEEAKKQNKNIQDLKKLGYAEKSGLSQILRSISPTGGRFEIQSDGAIRIIPGDDSFVKKLLSKKSEQSNSSSSKKISKDSKELMSRLQKANDQGLSNLLNKLAADGGKFELIDNGGIRVIPNDVKKAKEIAKTSGRVSKLVEKKGLKRLSITLRGMNSRVDSWAKVSRVARAWLDDKNKKDLFVGKIRHIKWLYIVSIVTEKGNMDTQLVIRASDGKAVAFTHKDFEIIN